MSKQKKHDTYEPELYDEISVYVIVDIQQHRDHQIVAWTYDKDMAEAYMEFHSCKSLRLEKIHDQYKKIISEIINPNNNDEIDIYFLTTSINGKAEKIAIPSTLTEQSLILTESDSMMATIVNFQKIYDVYLYLSKKYQKALRNLLAYDLAMEMLAGGEKKPTLKQVKLDEVKMLMMFFPTRFGMHDSGVMLNFKSPNHINR